MREALLMHEEALRVNRMCRELREQDILQVGIRKVKEWLLFTLNAFQEVLEPPPVMPATTYQLTLAFPDFSQYKVSDLFKSLGPVAVFSAKHHWTAPRTIHLRKRLRDAQQG